MFCKGFAAAITEILEMMYKFYVPTCWEDIWVAIGMALLAWMYTEHIDAEMPQAYFPRKIVTLSQHPIMPFLHYLTPSNRTPTLGFPHRAKPFTLP